MTSQTRSGKWFVPGDLNGFFGLVVDNLSILGFIAAALIGIFQFPAEVVFTRMFPGTALGVLVGNLIYTWMAHRLAAKTWAGYLRERGRHPERIARTVVLKLKTTDFRVLTRSLTGPLPPTSEADLAAIACALRARVDLPATTRFRLAGVGLSGFSAPDGSAAQDDLFARY